MRIPGWRACLVSLALLATSGGVPTASEPQDGKQAPDVTRSAKSGPWSAAATWEGGKVPASGAKVQVRTGHTVTYDVATGPAIRTIHIAGRLTFAPERDTRLDVGLIRIQAGDDFSEEGFDCDGHVADTPEGQERAALEVGTPDRPIHPGKTALIRLTYFEGHDKNSCPAIVCCGGRMDFHGAPLNRTWLKLAATAKTGDSQVTLTEAVQGWRVGDRVIVTATSSDLGTDGTRRPGVGNVAVLTEERTVQAIDGAKVTLDRPLKHQHLGTGDYRGAVANLSRNVIVESADKKLRGHTMYHRGSAGSISYAEFRHLGKENVLGRYSLHYHLCGNTMRGSYVQGASIWDSGNRWLTVHGTNYLVMRDNVGYQSIGHGFYLEDGTEVYNVFDRNLAVQAFVGKKLPRQILAFDENEGAGFWWANSLNTFTGNVACENDRYGYRFEATAGVAFKPTLRIQQPHGPTAPVDVRTLPFVRFDDNEAHCNGRYGLNLGEGVRGIGPDREHPFVLRGTKIWQEHYAFRPMSPCVLVEDMKIFECEYGVYTPNYKHHVYRNLYIGKTDSEPFNRGHDDDSIQYGPLTVDGLTFEGHNRNDIPLIQISDDNPTGKAVTHIRNLKVLRAKNDGNRAVVDSGGGVKRLPTTTAGVPIYLHDYYGPGRTAKVVSVHTKYLKTDGLTYKSEPPLTGRDARVAEVTDVAFPKLLTPMDDLPPITVITHVRRTDDGKLHVRGTTSDNGTVTRVLVNQQPASATRPHFAEWEVTLPLDGKGELKLSAYAEDAAGNVEMMPHQLVVKR